MSNFIQVEACVCVVLGFGFGTIYWLVLLAVCCLVLPVWVWYCVLVGVADCVLFGVASLGLGFVLVLCIGC